MLSNKNKGAIKSAVKKATENNMNPAKDKHVRAILMRTFIKDNSVEQIIRYLSLRLEKTNWVVVVKTLMIFHRCFKDGDTSFIDLMKPRSSQIFSLPIFSSTAPTTHLHTVFVKKYAKYLEEKVSVLRLLGYQFEKNQNAAKSLKPPKCFKVVPKLQSQLNALLNCKMRAQHIGQNPLIHRTYVLLIKDSMVLYPMLMEAMDQLQELFWKLKKKNAAKVITIYKLFVKETDALIGLYEIGQRFLQKLPEVKKVDSSTIDSMEKHVEKLPDDQSDEEDSGSEQSGGKKPTKKTKNKKQSDESDEDLREDDAEYDEYEEKEKKYEDDSEEEQNESSSGEAEPDENIFPGGFSAQQQQQQQQQQQPIAPSFGPGSGLNHVSNAPISYNDKAAFIKQISAVSDTLANPFQPNPMVVANPMSNPFGPQPGTLTNPFQQPVAQNPQSSPFSSNPFTVANPNTAVSFPSNNYNAYNSSPFSANNPGGNTFANPNLFSANNNSNINPFSAPNGPTSSGPYSTPAPSGFSNNNPGGNSFANSNLFSIPGNAVISSNPGTNYNMNAQFNPFGQNNKANSVPANNNPFL